MVIMELPYVAGLFDGEGCVSVYARTSGGFVVQAGILMTDRDVIVALYNQFGGSFMKRDRADGRNQKVAYAWRVGGQRASAFLKSIRPWMRVKHLQADLAHVAISIAPGVGKMTADEMRAQKKARDMISERMGWLNRRGRNRQDEPEPAWDDSIIKNSSITRLFGVRQQKSGRWQSFINYGGRNIPLGTYDTADKAHDVAMAKKASRVENKENGDAIATRK